MYFKIIKEEGEFLQNGTRVNLISGNKIFTPNGEVKKGNLQGFFEFDTLADAIKYFGLEYYNKDVLI